MKSLLVAEVPEARTTVVAAPIASAAAAHVDRAPRDPADSLARIFIVALFSFMVVRIGANYLRPADSPDCCCSRAKGWSWC